MRSTDPLLAPLPLLHGEPPGSAQFRCVPEDFAVEEILGFEPSGDGEHCLLWVEKRELNSNETASLIAEALGIRKRLVSHCGLKDRNAVTRQWFSAHLPGMPSPDADSLQIPRLKVLRVTRNLRKLRRGIHAGNRFRIRLRECRFEPAAAEARWAAIAARGVPNVFGEQRFGNDGRNLAQARALFRGEIKVRDRLLRGLFLSAARSALFNAFVAARMAAGTWDQVLDGEVFGFADNRSLILPERLRGDEEQRLANGELELTAPLWGAGKLHSRNEVNTLETGLAEEHRKLASGLEAMGLRQERRVMRLRPRAAQLTWMDGDALLEFELPKGAYATTVLREFASLNNGDPTPTPELNL